MPLCSTEREDTTTVKRIFEDIESIHESSKILVDRPTGQWSYSFPTIPFIFDDNVFLLIMAKVSP